MTAPWSPLLPIAMVGTDRQQLLPSWPGEIGELLAQAAGRGDDPAANVLRAAAVLATCDLAGAQGVAWTEPLPPAAADDAWPALPEGTPRELVRWALHEGPPRLQLQVLAALAGAQRRLPPPLLPQALELGRRSLALRPLLSAVLGERGLWLAAQREEWRFAAGATGLAEAGGDEARWTDGSLEQRREFLARERAADPRAAAERLQQALPELPAKERAELVAILAIGLGPDDEPLLETLRADRSREVRQAALHLLLRLPDAAHPRRAAARLEALLRHERVLLRKRWQVDAPAAAADDWKADGIEAARPQHESLGERAWWLYQLARQAPLAWWTGHTGLDAAELLRWVQDTDWAEALLRAWRDVLSSTREAAWCEALLDQWPKALREDPATVLSWLPLAARERHWQRQLRAEAAALPGVLQQVLAACPAEETLSPALSTVIVETVVTLARGDALAADYRLRALLPELCCALHVDAIAPLAALPRHGGETASHTDTLHAATQTVATRRALHSLPTPRTP